MSYVKTVAPEEASGELSDLYEQDRARLGYVPDYTRILSLRPEAISAWKTLSRATRVNIPLRRYELVTVAAALTLKCHY
jgi:hypothetical protein